MAGSWYVEQLLLEKEMIEISIIRDGNSYFYSSELDEDTDNDSILTDTDSQVINSNLINFDDETYNDLLDVLSAIKRMYDFNLLTAEDIKILEAVMKSQTYVGAATALKLTSITVSKLYSRICSKIAFFLGDKFTNIGFVNYLVKKHNLTEDQAILIYNYIGE